MSQRTRNGFTAVVGSIVVVLAGVTMAVIVGLKDWLGVIMAAFIFGVAIGSVGVLHR